jgi:hypothetical protein
MTLTSPVFSNYKTCKKHSLVLDFVAIESVRVIEVEFLVL